MKGIIKVKLREKPLKNGQKSLFLDFYPPIYNIDKKKETRREFLSLYLHGKPKTNEEKDFNKQTMGLAESIRSQRQLAIQSGHYGFLSNDKLNHDFVEYFKNLTEKRKGSNHDNWISALNYIEKFTDGKLKFADLNESWCNDFKEYLLSAPSKRSAKTTLSQNSVVSYFNKFKAALKQAHKDGYLLTDLNERIESVKSEETERAYLTIEELQLLVDTDCPMPILKSAALFSALTGLRFSDIQKMTWGEVQHTESGYFLRFQQQKTGGFETLPIAEQAFDLLGGRGKDEEKVFEGLQYSAWTNINLIKWVAYAGIKKDIHFHSFRHTYATLQLSFGTDIFTISKMLGHKDLKTTQIYSKIIDKTKREAADKIKLKF
jgi:integrase